MASHIKISLFNGNHNFMFGIFAGLLICFYIPQDILELVQQEECQRLLADSNLVEEFGYDVEPHLNLINKPLAAKKVIKNVLRQRYYSSELGIREKIFIGVMTSPDNINTLATAINQTIAHLVNKIKYFIHASNVKANYKLKNIVGFTDELENLKPFHVIKYIADNYVDDYDYFFIIPDNVYVDIKKLKQFIYQVSITFDIYIGTSIKSCIVDNIPTHEAPDEVDNGRNDYCNLNAGILLSSSIIKKMRNNLDWCTRNGISNDQSVNIGRCVKYSSNLAGCQEIFQGVPIKSYRLKPSVRIFTDLNNLSKDWNFGNATTVYPLRRIDDFFRLHAYFSRYNLEQAQKSSYVLEDKSYHIANNYISNAIAELRWPLGVPLCSSPITRHDIIAWHLLNSTHTFMPNADNIVEPLKRMDSLDLEKALKLAKQYGNQKHPNLKYLGMHATYRRFDPTRGMDYNFHLIFRNSHENHARTIKSFEVVKPLGRVEVVPSQYVTESTRIAILVPVFEHQIKDGLDFIQRYERACMKNQDNTFLLMIFLYHYDSASKGESDHFQNLKLLALDLSTKYKTDGSRIAWLSIHLTPIFSSLILPQDIMLTSLYARNEILSIAVADLALPKIGLESLILMASTTISFKPDFLNRVRMNTLQGYQIYSPIGFMMYPCKFANFCAQCENCDVSQNTGYFDKWNYDVISFYSRDYVQARKLISDALPIIRKDSEIDQLLRHTGTLIKTVLDMFVSSKLSVHILRGAEPNLRYDSVLKKFTQTREDELKCHSCSKTNLENRCFRLASRKQLGDAIIRFEDKSILNK